MRLIVVDDEVDVQFLFQQKFRKEIKSGEIQIHYAFDGPSALRLLESLENRTGYLILSDINMPEMTGIELLKKILIWRKSMVPMITLPSHWNLICSKQN